MTRREFTDKITLLVREMVEAGDEPVIDFVMRSREEQKRLFDKGLSKCDGYDKLSNHQRGLAADIYLCEADVNGTHIMFEWREDKSDKWHRRWEAMGGKSLIVFSDGTKDYPHFEGG